MSGTALSTEGFLGGSEAVTLSTDGFVAPSSGPGTTIVVEDYWQNQVRPVLAVFVRFNPNDVEEIPAGKLHGQPDEDFWINPVPRVVFQTFRRFNPNDVEEIPAGKLHGQPDEDFWINPVRPVGMLFRPFFPADDGAIVVPPFHGDEDFWINPVRPVRAALYIRLAYLPDPDELPLLIQPAGNATRSANSAFAAGNRNGAIVQGLNSGSVKPAT